MMDKFPKYIPRKAPTLITWVPYLALILFVILYYLAAYHYPGGAWRDTSQPGFNFWHNYLCDLLDTVAINGELNTARYYSRAALGVLCTGLLVFWYYMPVMFHRYSRNILVMWYSGIAAFLVTMLISDTGHDITVRIAGVLGVVALVSCFIELYRSGYLNLFILGVNCLIVFIVNYYIYETGIILDKLPTIQKFTFVLFLIWFFLMNKALRKMNTLVKG